MRLKLLCLPLIAVILASCGSTGGTYKGMFPLPKSLSGDVNGDYYFSKNKEFKVMLPYAPNSSKSGSYEWKYAEVHEIYQPNKSGDKAVVGVVFGPAAFDKNKYHAVLIPAPMKEPKEAYVKDVFDKKVAARAKSFKLHSFEIFSLNENDVYYAVYKDVDQFLILSLTDLGDSFFAVESDVMLNNSKGPKDIEYVAARKWVRFNRVLETFTVLR